MAEIRKRRREIVGYTIALQCWNQSLARVFICSVGFFIRILFNRYGAIVPVFILNFDLGVATILRLLGFQLGRHIVFQKWVFVNPSLVEECLDCFLANISIENTLVWFWAQRVVGRQDSITVYSKDFKIIWLVDSWNDDPWAFSETKELVANHLDVKVFVFKQSVIACDISWLLEFFQKLVEDEIPKIVVRVRITLDLQIWLN